MLQFDRYEPEYIVSLSPVTCDSELTCEKIEFKKTDITTIMDRTSLREAIKLYGVKPKGSGAQALQSQLYKLITSNAQPAKEQKDSFIFNPVKRYVSYVVFVPMK
eukprot:m.42513 g.42513  ORF g.42513 m.42513 type:complete len:105 (+) comp9888_c0_seq3:773-1087(+)